MLLREIIMSNPSGEIISAVPANATSSYPKYPRPLAANLFVAFICVNLC